MTTQHPAASASLDLDKLERYGWTEDTGLGVLDIRPRKGGNYVRFADVEALLARRATHQPSEADERCAHCKRLPGDPEGYCDWIECPVGSAIEGTTANTRCEECAGTGKIGPNENPIEMDCEVCGGSGRTGFNGMEQIERAAKAIYRLFDGAEAHPWRPCGNSNKQDEARRYARAALTRRATTAEQQAACTGAGCADLSCLACGGSGDKPAATTASASIGDDRAFRQRLHSARMAISDAEQQAADAELVAYLDSRTTAPSREAAPQALRHLCDQIDGMKRTMFLRPGTGQNYSYLVHEDVAAYIEEARAALAQQSASPGSRAIDFNKLAVLMTHYLAGNVPDDLYWRVDVTAEVLRRAVAVVRDAAQVQQSAAPGGADFETWWNTPNPKTGQPPSEVIDRNSARYAWEAAQAQAGGSDAQDGAVKLTRDDMGMCIVSLEVDGQWVDVIKDNGDFISHIVEPIGIKAAIDRAAAAARVLTCETCGADRSKERCKAEHWQRCSMMGQAQSAAGQEGGAA